VVQNSDMTDAIVMIRHLTETLKPGRLAGTKAADPELAKAFGLAVRGIRLGRGISQEGLAAIAEIERAHMGRIERGEKTPSLRLIMKISQALKISSAEIMTETEKILKKSTKDKNHAP
jgi:ribosome-binding protein aMBF1 (putative translation factor)